MTRRFISKSLKDTSSIAEKIIPLLDDDCNVLTLEGPPGSGKTTFIGFLLRNFGVTSNIVSPTYTATKSYYSKGKVFHHVDLYTFNSLESIYLLDIEGMMSYGFVFIEWPHLIKKNINKCLHISISLEADSRIFFVENVN